MVTGCLRIAPRSATPLALRLALASAAADVPGARRRRRAALRPRIALGWAAIAGAGGHRVSPDLRGL